MHTLQVDVHNNSASPTGMDLSGILSGSVKIVPCPSGPCVGDCGFHGAVTVDDTLTIMTSALGEAAVSTCTPGDANRDSRITVDEIIRAVGNALNGCSPGAVMEQANQAFRIAVASALREAGRSTSQPIPPQLASFSPQG